MTLRLGPALAAEWLQQEDDSSNRSSDGSSGSKWWVEDEQAEIVQLEASEADPVEGASLLD
eukprot:CAMPEP_0115538782 /NCGR_PEP_ID=MMETSP0271-20121206/89058_1 /TAXON_ID=71861 /ORGANISM="Scrippsiella trochoidea, Strain CCMP3099" /LENGTH=60 /DNA_ID=CAMNT_0002971693 /DNA_START=38 /DNA_END=218 /DNA_ORIENTATION=+